MPEFLTALVAAIRKAGAARRLMWFALLALPLAALTGAWLLVDRAPYRVLYPGLSDRAGGEVVAALEKLDIPYRVREADGAIEVPQNQLHIARFKLAAQGLPRSDAGSTESSDATPLFGLSQFQEQLRYQRALEAELVRSIESMSAVESARVHLALPKASPFLRDPPPATAAVVVRLAPGAALGEAQVFAIRRMVAASVPRLKEADVTVLDQEGHWLGPVAGPDEARRAALETSLAARVRDALVPWLGADAVKVQVAATLATAGDASGNRTRRARQTDAGARAVERIRATVIVTRALGAAEVEKATRLARQALGIDPARGDSVLVFALPPAHSVARPGPPAAPAAHAMPPWAWGAAAGAVLLAALGAWAWQRRRRSRVAASGQAADLPQEAAFEDLLARSKSLALADPRVTADVIRLWMRA